MRRLTTYHHYSAVVTKTRSLNSPGPLKAYMACWGRLYFTAHSREDNMRGRTHVLSLNKLIASARLNIFISVITPDMIACSHWKIFKRKIFGLYIFREDMSNLRIIIILNHTQKFSFCLTENTFHVYYKSKPFIII